MADVTVYFPTLGELRRILNKKVFGVFGAGQASKRTLRFLSPLKPIYIVDNNPAIIGTKVLNFNVTPVSDTQSVNCDYLVFTTLNYFSALRYVSGGRKFKAAILVPPELIYGYN